MLLVAAKRLSFEWGRVNWRPSTQRALLIACAPETNEPALLLKMRRPTALLVLGGCVVALVPRATPARPRTRLQASLDSFLADRSAAKLFYDGVTDGKLNAYDGPSLEDNSLSR